MLSGVKEVLVNVMWRTNSPYKNNKMGKIMRLEMVIYFYSKHFFGLFSSGYAENKLVEP